ncbi:hypothetical protein ACS0TY_000278 [Phlomoides rotata]
MGNLAITAISAKEGRLSTSSMLDKRDGGELGRDVFMSRPLVAFVLPIGSTRKLSGNTRRIWTTREEKVLLAALKDLVAKGQKTDNGFCTGYLNKLEDALRKAFPGCDLQATPHITSKITTWRKHYSAIVSAKLLVTGVGFNTTTCQLDCTNDQWDSILKKDSALHGIRHKEWHYFVDWIDIFGKDHATSEAAKEEENSVSQKAKNTSRQRSGGKKRKSNYEQSEPELTKLFGEFCKSTGERLEIIVSRIGYDHDLGAARKQIYEQLGKIERLSIKDKLHASKIIGGKVETLEMWTTLPDDARVVFIMEVLGRD